jgi:hypothetical protein
MAPAWFLTARALPMIDGPHYIQFAALPQPFFQIMEIKKKRGHGAMRQPVGPGVVQNVSFLIFPWPLRSFWFREASPKRDQGRVSICSRNTRLLGCCRFVCK